MHKTRLPTLLGLFLVFGTVMVFSLIFDRVTPLVGQASVSTTPANVVIANVTDTTFSVSWTTPGVSTGAIAVEDASGTKYTAFDDRDQIASSGNIQPTLGKYTTHMVTVRSAKPNTPYHARIVSNGRVFGNGPKSYDVTTGPALSSNGTVLEPAFGSITTATDRPAEGALVYLALEGSQTLATFVKSSGSWVIPLNLIRTENYQSFVSPSDRIAESIIVRTSNGDATAVTDTINDNPVPAMVIGKNYDFRKIQAMQPAQPTPTAQLVQANPVVLGMSSQAPSGVIALLQPKDGSALSSSLPLISGSGVPNHQVQLIIGITSPTFDTISIGADGLWRFTPKENLPAGKQSVTMTTTDAKGKATAITHIFEILKSGTQVLGDATPSATLAPTPTPTAEIPIVTPMATPTETVVLAGQPLPDTGSPLPLEILLVLGLGLLTTGAFILHRP